jgi:DNA-binding GntR family transcriptional regulator
MEGAESMSMTPVGSLKTKAVAVAALEAIRERILRGELAEGAQIRQEAVAAEFGISAIPVREALRHLEAEGLVTFQTNRGAVVSSLSLDEIEEVYDIRALLEPDMLRRSIPLLSGDHLQAARGYLEKYDAALLDGELGGWNEWHWKFHSTLYQPGNRPVSIGIVRNLNYKTDRYARMRMSLTGWQQAPEEGHAAILDRCAQKDIELACVLLRRHITHSGVALVDFLRGQNHK